jgi:hypothetical protein
MLLLFKYLENTTHFMYIGYFVVMKHLLSNGMILLQKPFPTLMRL